MRGWLVVLVACGSPHAADDARPTVVHDGNLDGTSDAAPGRAAIAASGSRLKLTWYQTTDGVRVPTQTNMFYDNARGEMCTVWNWIDGHTYCSPVASSNYGLYYTDSACTMPILKPPLDAPYVAVIVGVGCDNRSAVAHLYKQGPLVAPPTVYWTKNGSTCGDPTGPGAGTPPFYEAQEVVPSTDLVEITTTPVGTGPLQQVKWEGADGLLWPLQRGYDTSLGAECNYQDVSSTSARCTPADGSVENFADATCTTPKLDVPSSSCHVPTRVSVDRRCGAFDSNVYAVGTATTATPLFDSRCHATTAGQGDTFYSLGPAIGTTTTLSRGFTTIPGQRLAPIFLQTTDVNFWDFLLYDPVLGAECGFGRDPNGNPVCIPRQEYTISLFSDGGCTQPVDIVSIDPDACGAFRAPPVYAWKQIQQGPAEYEIHRVGSQHSGVLYSGSPGPGCDRYDVMGPEFFDIDSTVVPWNAFEPATIVIDP